MIILENLLLFCLLMTAIMVSVFDEVLNSIISISIFSIVLSVLYLIYRAPDVSLAEVVIGAGLNTALFITTISQVRYGEKCRIIEERDK
jgi:energy-converting hydrogenase B subunit D